MIRFVFVTAAVLACVCDVKAEDCFISSQPSMHRITDSRGVLQDNKKGRMLPVLVSDVARESAIQVEFVDLPAPYDIWNGAKLFARAPVDMCEMSVVASGTCVIDTYVTAKLECTDFPFATDWNSLGVVNVWHEGIVPGGTYNVRVIDAICNPAVPANYSDPKEMQTARFGDTVGATGWEFPADNAVDIIDALAGLATFTTTPRKPSKSRTELQYRCIDMKASVSDLLLSLSAFSGASYPESPSTVDPCDSNCADP